MAVEIERKFLIDLDSLHFNLESFAKFEILQGYIITGPRKSVRIRSTGNACILTVKEGSGTKRTEYEGPLPKETFDALWPAAKETSIQKTRYVIPYEVYEFEIDVYHGKLEGLVTVEVEFKSMEVSEEFIPPSWFGKEVTGEYKYLNSTLASMLLPWKVSVSAEEKLKKDNAISFLESTLPENKVEIAKQKAQQELFKLNLDFLEDGRIHDTTNGTIYTNWELDQPANTILEVEATCSLREFLRLDQLKKAASICKSENTYRVQLEFTRKVKVGAGMTTLVSLRLSYSYGKGQFFPSSKYAQKYLQESAEPYLPFCTTCSIITWRGSSGFSLNIKNSEDVFNEDFEGKKIHL